MKKSLKHLDSILVNVPVSSPIHPQANLPYLQGFLKQNGFKVKGIDTNVRFFNWFLKDQVTAGIKSQESLDDPLKLLKIYNDLDQALYEGSKTYRDLLVGLRNISLYGDRTDFSSILRVIKDRQANPFIQFYEELIDKEIAPNSPRIIGIGIIFQDQIVAAFTLADLVKQKLPEVKVVLGGQMITRCYDTMLEDGLLNHLWDYLVLWDGEIPFLNIHKKVIQKAQAPLTNVIEKNADFTLDRSLCAFDLDSLKSPDFSDLDFNEYLFCEMLYPLQTARGCYGSCEFCAIPAGSNSSFRQRTPEHIAEDIARVQSESLKRYGRKATYFKFMDDTSSPKTLLELSRKMESMGLDACWETFVRLEKPFEDIDFMKQLYRGGCRKLMWGLETNNPDILKKMHKNIDAASMDKILHAARSAGIINFVFILLGFPGETKEQRDMLAEYVANNQDIHVLTIATFDVTKASPIQKNFTYPNAWDIEIEKSNGFQVRLPYTVRGANWKKEIVGEAHRVLIKIIKQRPDIGFMSLFPDQVRAILGNKFGNDWGKKFLEGFGKDNVRQLLLSAENYAEGFSSEEEIDLSVLPEPIKREHMRTVEDIKAIADAISMRKKYVTRRMDQV